MSLINLPPLPMSALMIQTDANGKLTGLCSSDWYQALFGIIQRQVSSSQVITNPIVALTAQDASLSATSMPVGAISNGVYRLGWYATVSQAASSSSSLTVIFQWVEGGVAKTFTGTALTTNTTTASQSGQAIVRADAATPLTYSTTYASVGGTPMLYSLTILAEFMGA